MPIKMIKGRMRRVPAETPLAHHVERLFKIVVNLAARCTALEMALARMTAAEATPPKRVRKPSQKSAE